MSEEGPDLVVAGAGGGLIAALRAAQLGLDVLVVEASEHFLRGNNTSMCTAMVPGVGSRWQREQGIEDSVDLFAADVDRKTKGTGDQRLARALAAVSGEMVEWMADEVGLEISLMTDMHYPGHSVDRCHTIPERHGTALIDHLARRARAHPNIDFLVPARLTDVELDADGRVAAVVVTDPHGEQERIETPAVLLATNGYGADRELVAEHMPEIAAATYHGSETSRGDALRIGARLGAATAYLDAYQGHGALAAKAATLLGWATIMHGAVMLDTTGHRFAKETSGYSEFGPFLAARPGATGWVVYDRRVHDLCEPFTDFRQTAESGAEVWADDARGLAAATGLPEEAVVAELEESARAARGEIPDRFGRDYEAPLEPPYAAVRVVPALFHTQGGLVVDGSARVVDADDRPIRGLYASGGAAAGISGHGASGYLAGNGLLPAFGLAYLAATAVASERAGGA
ncbi:FAD-dependent oxidoreductase [Streptomyces brasiliensis]|uniref:Fumarate reductase flavoprotein subunit n=1 Tax=Streptomyces brasiliensis TaxID=1954 RepID=A0A917P0W5_9ACTN|nr:FAD-binding protein [Streptomyces brasiliensis]GGJ50110.1 fumarate reductase flavoprotein subunit [Streptomyces brasiliensis]